MVDHELLQNFTEDPNVTGYVAGMGSVESGYFHQTAPALSDFLDKDLAPLMVAISYLTQLEV